MKRFAPAFARSVFRPQTRGFASVPKLAGVQPDSNEEFKTYDGLFESAARPHDSVDPTKRAHTYFVMGATKMAYASAARLAVVKVVGSLSASADVLALSSVEVDTSAVDPGTCITVKWRGKPVFIKRRTPEEIASAQSDDSAELRDPQTDAERAKDPEWMVVMGICTHLGCVPIHGAGDFGGWFCPCHGSHYDNSGRIRKGPAPLNLEIPEYSKNGNTIILG
mmetsp:Transcript_11202/g.16085  ORF Transcript_11202/g.16085 Transcript_11202/m.16085 type:complete len:222 (+) Transcript_11202:33-698(+)|eukprot:CAMPEP_0175101400 /NCGR_PEP_ID=MMETSP0086_2-20121207/7774_1 /TAXON_ID=136419 /ORGANISM="Unknown Unknown, Strain D1" /LENGTH=221 /DNA_ID=CAMNT_0016375923 /DNA_START=28 /DNA_END=693 /DNA_ORIENTATION=-